MTPRKNLLPDIQLSVVIERGQLSLNAVRSILEFVPDADVRVGPTRLKRRKRGVTDWVKALEFQFMSPLGKSDVPIAARPLSDGDLQADLILDLREGPPDPQLARQARYGVVQPGTFDSDAVLRGDSKATIALVGIGPREDTLKLLAEAFVQCKWLVTRTELFALEKSIQLFRHVLAQLRMTGTLPDLGPLPILPQPARASHALAHGVRLGRETVGRILNRPGRGARRQPFAVRLGQGTPEHFDIGAMKDVPNPDGGLRGDPFFFEEGGSLYCFFEDLPSGKKKGVIAVALIEGDQFKELGVALEASHHLSYPLVFAHEDDIYMIPETIGGSQVEVWRASDFPLHWELHATALEGERFADPVLFRHADQWWLMASPSHDSIGDFSSELWLFEVDGPGLSHVDPHPLNPVVVGSDTGRGAGRVFASGGRLYRMAQNNCGPVYGYGLNVMEITDLTSTSYEERCIQRVTADDIPGAIGVHHMDFAQGRVVADVRWP